MDRRRLGAKGPVHLKPVEDALFHLGNFSAARLRYQAAQQQSGQSAPLDSKLGVCDDVSEITKVSAARNWRSKLQPVPASNASRCVVPNV
jgi:hypothetical protein